MGTSITVKGRSIKRPGMYSQIKSGVKNASNALSYGGVLIIDTAGLLEGWAAGAGISGELTEKSKAIYSFDNIEDYRNHVKGGYLWHLGQPLFFPSKRAGSKGASLVTVIKPAVTTAAEISFGSLLHGSLTIQTLDEGTGANGELTSGNLSKGYAAKIVAGTVDTSKVVFRFYVSTYRGVDTFNSGKYFGNTTPAVAKPQLLIESPEFSTLQEFVDWTATSNTFKSYFKLKSGYSVSDAEVSTVTCVADVSDSLNGKYFLLNSTTTSYYVWYKTSGGTETDPAIAGKTGLKVTVATGATAAAVATATALVIDGLAAFTAPAPGAAIITVTNVTSGTAVDLAAGNSGFTVAVTNQGGSTFTSTDLVTYAGYTLAAGATESYSSTELDLVMEYINDLEFSFVLTTSNASNAQGTENATILSFLQDVSKYERVLGVGGGYDSSHFKLADSLSSQETANYFDSELVIIAHSGIEKAVPGSVTPKVYDSLYHIFAVIGRAAGLPPQTPLTLKDLDIDGLVHPLTEREQEAALDAGVTYTYYDTDLETFVVGQGVTTLQDNQNQINEDGTSFSLQIVRIKSQINKELAFDAKRTFYSSDSGPNKNTLSSESISTFLEGFLSKRHAKLNEDNLLLTHRNITVIEAEDNFEATYELVPNGEINKGLFTGYIFQK